MASTIQVVLLGVAQDAGLPQAGCDCVNCVTARAVGRNPCVVSLGIIDHTQQAFWMVDATPDFPQQLQMLRERAPGATF
ncbi:MAG: pyrroloquinoline quinone biosynthesis protein PqqB, partial [Pseudomonadota bacterium]|nr:pyrroloquinoline quinone biosynthesis protein PqqB [Pseudomonadota bacterium]